MDAGGDGRKTDGSAGGDAAGDARTDARTDAADARGDAADGAGSGDAAKDGLTGDAGDDGPPPNGSCERPFPIVLSTPAVDLSPTTVGAGQHVTAPCATGGTNDVVFQIILQAPELIYADTFGTSWNTTLLVDEICPGNRAPSPGTGQIVCSDDACGTTQSQVVAYLPSGIHYLVLGGTAGQSGAAKIHFEHVPVGAPQTVMPMPAKPKTLTGTTAGMGRTSICEAGGPENSYWWTTCPSFAGGDMQATTCGGATWDTALVLQVPRTSIATCADDDPNCGRQSTLTATLPAGAGLSVLTVDGATNQALGDFTVSLTLP